MHRGQEGGRWVGGMVHWQDGEEGGSGLGKRWLLQQQYLPNPSPLPSLDLSKLGSHRFAPAISLMQFWVDMAARHGLILEQGSSKEHVTLSWGHPHHGALHWCCCITTWEVRIGLPTLLWIYGWNWSFSSAVSKLEIAAAPKSLPSATGAYCSAKERWDSRKYSPQVSLRPAQNAACKTSGTTLWGFYCGCPNTPQGNSKHQSPSRRKQ